MADLRPPVKPFRDVLGVAATVTRPAPDDTAIATTAIWVDDALEDAQPYGSDFTRRNPRRRLALPREDVETCPRGTTIVAPEITGGDDKTWRVDEIVRVDPQFWQVAVLQVS